MCSLSWSIFARARYCGLFGNLSDFLLRYLGLSVSLCCGLQFVSEFEGLSSVIFIDPDLVGHSSVLSMILEKIPCFEFSINVVFIFEYFDSSI